MFALMQKSFGKSIVVFEKLSKCFKLFVKSLNKTFVHNCICIPLNIFSAIFSAEPIMIIYMIYNNHEFKICIVRKNYIISLAPTFSMLFSSAMSINA